MSPKNGNPVTEKDIDVVVTIETPEGHEEFDNFEDLARKLVNVPKPEIDEERQKA